MDDFERALRFVLAREGGLVDDPLDKGGRTNKGITQRTYDGWRTDQKLEKRDVAMIDNTEVSTIYRNLYWWPAKNQPWPLSLVVFDTAVLFGVGRASEWLAAVDWADVPTREKAFAVLCLRRERHRASIAKDKSQARFWNGWSNRIASLMEEGGNS